MINPALTAKEWNIFQTQVSGCLEDDSWEECVEAIATVDGNAHAMAAKLLYSQHFGFTHSMVDGIRFCQAIALSRATEGFPDTQALAHIKSARLAADAILALLPPRP